MKQKILSIIVLFGLLINLFGASADTLSDYQGKYNHLSQNYNSAQASYNAISANYNTIKNSGNIALLQKNIALLKDIEADTTYKQNISAQDAQELVQIGGSQETKLADDFKWLSVAFQNLKDKATADIAELEQALQKQQTKEELYNKYLILKKAVWKEQQEKSSFSVLATINHIKTLDKAIDDEQKISKLKLDIFDLINQAIGYENQADDAGETEIENNIIELKYQLYSDQSDIKADEIKLKEFLVLKVSEEKIKIESEFNSMQNTVNTLQTDLQKAQCAQDSQGIFNTMTSLKSLNENDMITKKQFLYDRANNFAEVSMKESEVYFTQIANYEALGDKITSVLNAKFDPKNCPSNGNPVPPPPPPSVNKAPLFTKVGSQDVKPGVGIAFNVKPTEKIEFTLVATDDDKDALTYSIESSPVGAVFDPAKQIFTWTPTNTQLGVYTFGFKVLDTNGGEAKVSVTVTVSTTGVPQADVTVQEQTFKDLKNQFDVYDDDFNSYENSYTNAVKKSDTSNVNKYKKKLKNLDDDLKSLNDKLDNLLTEVEKLPGTNGLAGDIQDKQDDIKSLRTDIKDVLNGKQKTSSQSNNLSANQLTGTTKTGPEKKAVVVEKLPILPGTAPTVTAQTADQPSTSFGMMTLLIGGVVVLIAVIIFLLALLVA